MLLLRAREFRTETGNATDLSNVLLKFCKDKKKEMQIISENDIHMFPFVLIINIRTCRNESSSAFICSSTSLIAHLRDTICLLVFSVLSFIIWLFCCSSSRSTVILATSSLRRISRSSSNSLLIFSSVSWVWTWQLTAQYNGQSRSITPRRA